MSGGSPPMNTLRENILLEEGSGRSRFIKEHRVSIDFGGLCFFAVAANKKNIKRCTMIHMLDNALYQKLLYTTYNMVLNLIVSSQAHAWAVQSPNSKDQTRYW